MPSPFEILKKGARGWIDTEFSRAHDGFRGGSIAFDLLPEKWTPEVVESAP
jgi:hypothetical protein